MGVIPHWGEFYRRNRIDEFVKGEYNPAYD